MRQFQYSTVRARIAEITAVAVLLAVPRPAYAYDEATADLEPTDSVLAPDVTPSTLSVAAATTGRAAKKTPEIPVSARGTYSTSVPIETPPGRHGMQPRLALAYDSGAATRDSPVGAGWSLSTPRIERSTLHGFPTLERAPQLRYAESVGAGARYSFGDVELAPLSGPPTTGFEGAFDQDTAPSEYFVAVRGTDATVYEHNAAANGWVVHRPDGSKAAYGADPHDAQHSMRITNELGTYAWLLLREWDRDGNRVVYNYFPDDVQRTPTDPQAVPVLSSVAWGGRDAVENAGLTGSTPDVFSVEVKLGNDGVGGGADLLHGNVRPDRLVHEIDVCAPIQTMPRVGGTTTVGVTSTSACAGSGFLRSYTLTQQISEDTSRWLLNAVTIVDSDIQAPRVITYSYSTNDGKAKFGAPIPFTTSPGMQQLFTRARAADDASVTFPAVTPDDARYPPITSGLTRLLDLDGDGRTDVLYFPAGSRAPFGPIVPTVTPIVFENGGIADALVGTVPRTAFNVGAGSYDLAGVTQAAASDPRAPPLSVIAHGSESTGFRADFEYTDFADLDGDGRTDGLYFYHNGGRSDDAAITDVFRLPPSPRGSACYSETMWNQCGVIDPASWESYDLCDAAPNVCASLAAVNLDTCASGTCWITPRELSDHFSDLADWSSTPPDSEEGQQVLAANNMHLDWALMLVAVPAAALRARLNIAASTEQPKLLAAGQADTGICGDLNNMCSGGAADGIPRVHIDFSRRRLACDISQVTGPLVDFDCSLQFPGIAALPTVYLGVHFGGGVPSAEAASLELLGWPSSAGKQASLVFNQQNFEYASMLTKDFTAPLVDLNADSRADIVLLREMTISASSGVRPEYEFTPRAFISNDKASQGAYYGAFDFDLDWKSFHDQNPDLHDGDVVSDFSQSLNDILVAQDEPYGSDIDSTPVTALRYPQGYAYNAFMLDANGDGLPDLVAAHPDSIEGGHHALNLDTGHDVYLNRGYRFGVAEPGKTPDPATGYHAGALTLLQKAELHDDSTGVDRPVARGTHVPMAASALVDINADGRVDVVFWVAQPSDPSPSPSVWLNRGDRFIAVGDIFCIGQGGSCTSERAPTMFLAAMSDPEDVSGSARQIRGFEAADLMRLVDVNDDGLTDIVVPGIMCPEGAPVCPTPVIQPPGFQWEPAPERGQVFPAAVWLNSGTHPDLLTSISDNRGASTAIAYENARTSTHVQSGYVPPGMQVVSEVTSQRDLDGDKSQVDLTYADWVRSRSAPESLGFTSVTATFTEHFGNEPSTTATLTRTFDVTDSVAGIPYARRGLPVTEVFEADGLRDITETSYTATLAWPNALAVRLDEDAVTTTECQVDGGGNCIAPVSSTHSVDERDAYGFPMVEREGDGTDIETTTTTYEQNEARWILGLVDEQTVTGRSVDINGVANQGAVLAEVTATWDAATGHLLTRTRPGVTPTVCKSDAGGDDSDRVEVDTYDLFGNPTKAVENGLPIETVYDAWSLYPSMRTATVSRYKDGDLVGTSDLTTHSYYDLRTGSAWTVIDGNGAIVETRRDARGRPLVELDANGNITAEHSYVDVRTPTAQLEDDDTIHTSGTTARVEKSFFDAAGDLIERIVYTKSGTTLSDPTRVAFNVLDSAGLARQSYLPEKTEELPGSSSPFVERLFDARGRPTLIVTPDDSGGRQTSTTYLPRETITVDPIGVERHALTDWRGELIAQTVDAPGYAATITYERDGLGRLAAITDADGAFRRFENDLGGRIFKYTLPYKSAPSGVFQQCFDPRGSLVSTTDPDGRWTKTTTDEAGRPVLKLVSDGNQTLTYATSYDDPTVSRHAVGRPWRTLSPAGISEITYDVRGLPTETLTTIDSSIGGVSKLDITRGFGLQGEPRAMSSQNASTGAGFGEFKFDYDGRGRLTKISDTQSGGTVAAAKDIDAYDRIDIANLGQDGGGVQAARTWNPLSQDLEDVSYSTSKAILGEVKLTGFRKDGSPTEEDRSGVIDTKGDTAAIEKQWGYDSIGRLKSQDIWRNGSHITSERFSYSLGGRLLTAGAASYEYDVDGLQGAVTKVATGGSARTLGYDLSGNVEQDSDGSVVRTLRFAGNGCLTSVDAGTKGSFTQICDAAGNVVFRSSPRVLTLGMSELRPAEGLYVTRFPFGNGVEVEIAYSLSGVRSTSASRIVMSDLRGSIFASAPAVSSTLVTTTEAQDFDAWGKPISIAPAKPRHGYAGFEPDAIIGSYSFGRRVYDPSLRRWLSADPLIAASPQVDSGGSQLDLWGYAADNPVTNTDPDGTCAPGVGTDLCSLALETAYDAGMLEKGGKLSNYVEMAHAIENAFADTTLPSFSHAIDAVVADVEHQGAGRIADKLGIQNETGRKLIELGIKGVVTGVVTLALHKAGGLDKSDLADVPPPEAESRRPRAKERRAAERAAANARKTGAPDYEEPAPEAYAKNKAKELKKTAGADAARKAHDEKGDRGDRTKKELDDDYRN